MNHGWLLGIAAFAVFLLALPVVIRIFGGERRLIQVIVGTALAVFLIWFVAFGSTFDRHTFWGFVAIYGFFLVGFLQAFAIIFKSISLRTLIEIADLPDGALSFDQTHESLIVAGAYEHRLKNLEAGGFIRRTGSAIELTNKGQKAVRWLNFAQRIFGIANSG